MLLLETERTNTMTTRALGCTSDISVLCDLKRNKSLDNSTWRIYITFIFKANSTDKQQNVFFSVIPQIQIQQFPTFIPITYWKTLILVYFRIGLPHRAEGLRHMSRSAWGERQVWYLHLHLTQFASKLTLPLTVINVICNANHEWMSGNALRNHKK